MTQHAVRDAQRDIQCEHFLSVSFRMRYTAFGTNQFTTLLEFDKPLLTYFMASGQTGIQDIILYSASSVLVGFLYFAYF